jgi:hypothetical protein
MEPQINVPSSGAFSTKKSLTVGALIKTGDQTMFVALSLKEAKA